MAYNLSPNIYQLNFIPHYLFVLRSSINFLLCFPTSYVNKVGLSFFEQYWKINVLNIYIYISLATSHSKFFLEIYLFTGTTYFFPHLGKIR